MTKNINVPNKVMHKLKTWFLFIRKYMRDRRVGYGFILAYVLSWLYGQQYIAPLWCFGFLVVEDYFTKLVDARITNLMIALFLFYGLLDYNFFFNDNSEFPMLHNPGAMFGYFFIFFMGIHLASCKRKDVDLEKGQAEIDTENDINSPESLGMPLLPAAYVGLILSHFAPTWLIPISPLILEMKADAIYWAFVIVLFVAGSLRELILTNFGRNKDCVYYRLGDGDVYVLSGLTMLFSTFTEAFFMIWLTFISFIIIYILNYVVKVRWN